MPADANRVQLVYRDQGTVFDTVGTGAPTEIRYTSESLKQTTDNAASDEIREDRQRSDIIRTDIRAEGDINFELSYGEYDPFLSAGLQDASGTGSWAGAGTAIVTTAACSLSGSVLTLDSGTFDNDPVPGDVIQISDAVAAANNGCFTVKSVATSNAITVNESFTSATNDIITVTDGAYVKNGTTVNYFELQKEFLDIDKYAYYKNMVVDGFNLTIEPGSIITGGFNFMGTSAASTDTLSDTPVTAATTNSVMNAIDNVGTIAAGTASTASSSFGALTGVTQIALTVGNNMRSRSEIGRLGSAQPGSGTIDVTGTLQMYLENSNELDDYLNWTTSALRFAVRGPGQKGYSFWLPKIKFTDGQRVAGGINTDVIAEMSFTAFADASLGTLQIHRATN